MKNRSLPPISILWHRKNILLLISVLLTWTFLILSKDLFHSLVKGYAYYWYESLLFGSIWLLFIPFWILQGRLASRVRKHLKLILITILTSVLHVLSFVFLVCGISHLFFYYPFTFTGTLVEALADYSLTCFLVYGLGAYLFGFTPKKGTALQKIKLRHRNATVLITPKAIQYIQTERPYIAIKTEQQTYLHSSSLKQFKAACLPDYFIQIHRSTVINTHFIESFISRKNGDFDVRMADGTTLRVSRRYNTYFTSTRPGL